MALLYFYDATELDQQQISNGLSETDHHWEYVQETLSLDNLNPDTEVLSVFVSSTVTREIIEALPKLRLIACRSTGYNNVDFKAAEERDISVVNVPTYGESTVAEYAFTLLLSLTRKISQVIDAKDHPIDQTEMTGHDLADRTIGIIGAGHIGQHAIKIAKGFSMNVLVYDALPKPELAEQMGFTYVSLEDLLKHADIVSLHAPYLPATHHLLNKSTIALLQKHAILINTSRGELIDTAAITEALATDKIAGAALDVIEGEKVLIQHEEQHLLHGSVDSALLRHELEISILKKLPNVILSPHNAFNTVEAIQRINKTTTDNIISYWYGDIPNKVNFKQQRGKLILSRHAESEWNATGQWSGITDVHLSDKGFKESIMLARALQSFSIPLHKAYCSQQIRTRETLEGMLNASQQFDITIQRDGALNERDYGEYTGKNKWEMKELLGDEHFDAIRRGWDVAIPGGESLKMVYDRVVPFFKETILPQLNDGNNILLVAHGNSIRALIKYIESVSDTDVSQLEMLFGELLVYDLDDEGKMKTKSTSKIDSKPPNA